MSDPFSVGPGAYVPPADFSMFLTRDGSYTLYSHALDERYHSVHGAVQESFHVFIRMGFEATVAEPLRVLEIGLGTGLNMLLTWVEADLNERMVVYTALEPYPVPAPALEAMDHSGALEVPGRRAPFLDMMALNEGVVAEPSPHFRFERSWTKAQDLDVTEAFDLIYFDAFGPANQPEMWGADVFQRMFKALAPGGVLVTYCAKGVVRRTMQSVGFMVERVPGPVGKKEMLRARKPLR
jgi:tRNA U34 5-methylaminomethyl-2-thiouridine-forming methyltransferase MnmC